MEVMCARCHNEIDANVQERKKVLRNSNKSARSLKCGIPHWSFDNVEWLSHREKKTNRKRNITWQRQIDFHGTGKMTGGCYAFDEAEFHTDKEKFWNGASGMSGNFASKFVFADEDPSCGFSSAAASSNQAPVSAANAAQSGNRRAEREEVRRPWADETDQWEHHLPLDQDHSDNDDHWDEFDYDDDGHMSQKTNW
jgi:hypothetical protein